MCYRTSGLDNRNRRRHAVSILEAALSYGPKEHVDTEAAGNERAPALIGED